MKKLVAICFACIALTFAAGAANVGTIDNGYPGDTEAQAQMLCDLGLFHGTEKGFELDKSLTRAEAAAMLTRLLGAEQAALSGEWTHPFTDVPPWADRYVGWLYESGLTKGTSPTIYGAEENVTCGQYCTFLARAASDDDSYEFLMHYDEDEVAACDAAGFVRGDAVSLSARLLEQYYTKYGDSNGFSVAQKLVNQGVFTAEHLKDAAWDVLPRDYKRVGRTPYGSEAALSCVIAGVPVAYCSDDRIYGLYAPGLTGIYGYRNEAGQDYQLFWMDPYTLQTTELLSCAPDSQTAALGRAGQTDYLIVTESEQQKSTLYAARGTMMETVMELPKDAKNLALFSCLQGEDGCVFQYDDSTFYCLEEDGIRKLSLASGEKLVKVMQDGLLVTQNVTVDHTVISAWTWDGKAAGSFTVDNSYPIPEGLEQESVDTIAYWLELYAPCLQNDNGTEIWGSAGLYCVADARLVQITDQPTYAYVCDSMDGSFVIVTHAPDRHVDYSESAMVFRTGDTLMRIMPDGTEEWLLPQLPEGSLLLGEVDLLDDGRIQFTTLKPTEPRMMGRFTCILDNGKVTVTDATDDIFYMWGEDAVEKEQTRLDELGIGIGAE